MTSTLRTDVLRIEGAADPAGTLPVLHGISPYTADGVGIDDEMRRNLAYGAPHSLLPYTRQDAYGRTRAERELPTVVLENDVLTATFLPGYGGRLWSLVHRPTGRELLHRNRILQPANLALRDAWLAGGVEWNLGTTGHWPLTCEPLHAVRASAPDGTPVLRMYAFERLRGLVLRMDTWLPAGSPVLYVHVGIHNPSAEETPVYWWSNIAVPEAADVRVLAPADHAFHCDYVSDLKHVPFPAVEGEDRSYPGRAVRAADYFLDVPVGERRWIAALDETGTGLVQTSTDRLRGRKLFCWGTGTGGKHWQEWLSGPDSAYLEIQAGLARTQLEHLPMPAGANWSWVEAYGMLEADPSAVHGPWGEARSAAADALDLLVPAEQLDRALALAGEFGEPEQVLAQGCGWAALEIEAGRLTPSPLLPFGAPGVDQKPWRQLLATGILPISDPPAAPVTGARWRALLEESASDWHALYHLGLIRLADGEPDAARQAWRRSLAEQRSPWVLRGLAFLADTPHEAADLMAEAHILRPDLRELTTEVLDALLRADRPKDVLAVIEPLPAAVRGNGRIRLAEAKAAHALGDDDHVRELLAEGIRVDNMREGEVSLDTLWLAVHPGRPVPPHYDFRMSEG
ncbi:DUF5107 domain-containing protein [Kitasatospora sp. CM 4170]|uniref:DUF5107 domain-containing protein n=1 Tax=Kitasatospora aburaviensis TaxID=67265 RepID=A0ABW1EU92_9ACTN|nr:DUF5107 domain-containing protein [Kitasatospora sp. CM 4170]WNM49602.1 DUF5107 domain-containing protein [Kitasatospora sp. CM 4170]